MVLFCLKETFVLDARYREDSTGSAQNQGQTVVHPLSLSLFIQDVQTHYFLI